MADCNDHNRLLHVGLAPFRITMSDPVMNDSGLFGISLNCGLHTSRVVGKGGSKIQELIGKSGANLRVKRNSGFCDIVGSVSAVHAATQLAISVIEEGCVRDLRTAVSQAVGSNKALNGLLAEVSRRRIEVRWTDVAEIPSHKSILVPKLGLEEMPFTVPICLQ